MNKQELQDYQKEKRASFKKYQEEHKEEIKRSKEGLTESRLYRKNNPSLFKKSNKKWVNKNGGKEFMNKWMRNYRKYPDVKLRINNQIKQRRKVDKNFHMSNNLRTYFNQAMRLYSTTGKIMSSKRYGVDYEAIIKYLEPLPQGFLKKHHTHHIIPLRTFNHNDPAQIKEAWAPENHKVLTIEEHKKIDHLRLIKKINKFGGGSYWIKQFGYKV